MAGVEQVAGIARKARAARLVATGPVAKLTGKHFFPQLISGPFHHRLVIVFSMAITVLLVAAATSALRGGKYVHEEPAPAGAAAGTALTPAAGHR